jgi:hypothetical protein
MWSALSDERTDLSFARVTLSNDKVCYQYVQFTFYMLLNVYTIYKSYLPGSITGATRFSEK